MEEIKTVRFHASANVVYDNEGNLDVSASAAVYTKWLTKNRASIEASRKDNVLLLNMEEESVANSIILQYFASPTRGFSDQDTIAAIVVDAIGTFRKYNELESFEKLEAESLLRKSVKAWIAENSSNLLDGDSVFYTKTGRNGGTIHRRFINRVLKA